MKLRIHIRDRFDAITSVISAILAVTIVIGAALSIFIWANPYLDELRSKESLESAETQFNLIVDNIKDIVIERADGKNVLSVAVDAGSISIDKSDFDRTIVMYSYDSNYDFSVSSLDDNDDTCQLEMTPMDADFAWIYQIDDDGLCISDFYDDSLPTISTSGAYNLVDRIVIFLYDTNYDGGNSPFGKIWLFDSNSLIFDHHSSAETHELSLEKGGIIYCKDGNSQVKRLFNVYLEGGSFGLHVLQTLALKSFSASGDNGFNIKISVESRGTWVQEMDDIYNLRLQLHGDNAQTWLDYINNKYENKFVLSDEDGDGLDDTLFLSESDDGVQLTFLNSIVDIDKV